ncbi:MAG: preprotein translocase subunit SecY [Nanoarchaeota archaeon]
MGLQEIISYLPEVRKPVEKKVSFNVKLRWTLVIMGAFFILYNIPLHGLSNNALERFRYLAVLFGTDFGSVISLGIGPIVMSSIILQLLVGSGILTINTKTEEGKKLYQGLQKLGVLFFIVFEAMVYVLMQGLQAAPGFTGILIIQLILGGLAIMFMDEVVSKWGFGSGVSLFIVAGVALNLFTGLFQFIGPTGTSCLTDFGTTACTGKVLVVLQSIINGAPREALLAFAIIAITAALFLGIVWAQSLKIELPLSFDRLRGHMVKWPLPLFYASNIPVILVAALVANLQLFAGLIEGWLGRATFLGTFSNGVPVAGFAYWIGSTDLVTSVITGSLQTSHIFQAVTHLVFYILLSIMFSVFWVKTAGMDAASIARNIMASGLQIPGFRKDERVLESILSRYVMPLTIMGGIAVGALAAIADLFGVLTSGTSLLLAITITYQLFQNIAQQHAVDMHPALRKFVG